MQRKNNSGDVYEIQNYLRKIQLANNEKTLLNPDGIYGKETTEAVMSYQIRNGLPATGRVDGVTWEKIYNDFLLANELLSAPEKIALFPINKTEIKKGDNGDEVIVLQALLRTYDRRFGNPQILEITGVYDENTENSVKELQRVLDLPQTGVADKMFWNRAVRFHNNRFFSENY